MPGIRRVIDVAERLPNRWRHKGKSKESVPYFDLDRLLELAQPAPFGKGEDPLLDRNVQRCLEIDLHETKSDSFPAPDWKGLEQALEDISNTLLPGVRLDAVLDKLLVYQPNCFFPAQQDIKQHEQHNIMTLSLICGVEKHPFAPSWKHGGSVVFGRPTRSCREQWHTKFPGSYACWFNSEPHSVTPVLGGYRVALQYSVLVVGRVNLPQCVYPDPTSI